MHRLLRVVSSTVFIYISYIGLIGVCRVDAQMSQMGPPAVRVEAVGTLSASQPKRCNGIIAAKETVNLVPRVSGYLEKVAFQEGAMVKAGDLLFEIEDTVYEINVRVAESVVRQIEADIELAKKEHERATNLIKSKAISEQELDETLRAISLFEARLDEAKARLDQAKNDLSYTKIHAPLSGRIGAKQYSQGNYLTPTSGILATIVQFDPITVKFSMSVADFMKYSKDGTRLGQNNIEVFRADGQPYQGGIRIDFLDNQVDRRTDSITIYLICENPDNLLIPGTYTWVNISERFEQPLPAVNVAALMTDGSHYYVYVVMEENKVERRSVTVGSQVYDQQIVTSGLTPGETVVVGGLNKITPDIKVVQPIFQEPKHPEGSQPPQVKEEENQPPQVEQSDTEAMWWNKVTRKQCDCET